MKTCEACCFFWPDKNDRQRGLCCVVPPNFAGLAPGKIGGGQTIWVQPSVDRDRPACQASDLTKTAAAVHSIG